MIPCSGHALTAFALCLLSRTVVCYICVQESCRGGQARAANNTTTYYNIAMVTRKLSGILIMLLLFAVGYFVQRLLCTRSRARAAPLNGQPDVTASQEMLMDRCTPEGLVEPLHVAHLPPYDACKRLPTYEETMREGTGGRLEFTAGRAS